MYLSIGWSRLMKCDRDIWKIYFACQKCLQNLAIKFSGNLVDFSKCDPYLVSLKYFANTIVTYGVFCKVQKVIFVFFRNCSHFVLSPFMRIFLHKSRWNKLLLNLVMMFSK